ncbi:MAG: hypothetical protein WCG10_08120 [Chlamydiota bacterium]
MYLDVLLLSVLEHEFQKDTFFVNTSIHDDYYILMLGAVKPSFKELINDVIDNLLTSAHEISYSWVNIYDITCVGFLLRYDKAEEHEHFHHTILTTMQKWEKALKDLQKETSSLSFLNELVDNHQ